MTKEEAIKEIRSCLGVNNIIMPYSDEMIAFGMAIEALEKAEKYKEIITETIDGIDWYHNNGGDMVQGSNSDYETFVKFKDLVDAFYNIGLYGDEEE